MKTTEVKIYINKMVKCLCGCGLETKIIMYNNKNRGLVKGKSYRYILRHERKGKPLSEEIKKKIGLGNKGKIVSEETKKKIGLGNTGKLLGRHLSNKHKLKISFSMKGKNLGRQKTKDEIERQRQKMLGKKRGPRSEEVKMKIGLGNKGKIVSDKTKQKLRLANLGKKLPEEQKHKMSIAHMGKKFTKEHIQNCQVKRAIPTEIIVKKTLEEMAKEPFLKKDIPKKTGFHQGVFIRRWGSVNNFAKKYNITFKKSEKSGCIGNIEKIAFEEYKNKNPNNVVEPQYTIFINNRKRYYVDWYDKTTNTVFEFDEPYHKQNKIQDKIRDEIVKNKLNCSIKRIDMLVWLKNKSAF